MLANRKAGEELLNDSLKETHENSLSIQLITSLQIARAFGEMFKFISEVVYGVLQ